MKDRLNHNLERTITLKTNSGIKTIKVSDCEIQAKAHIDKWMETHPSLSNWGHHFLPKLVRYGQAEKLASYSSGFNRALELVKMGAIDIETVDIEELSEPSYSQTALILHQCKIPQQ
jgi:hypothetical protein